MNSEFSNPKDSASIARIWLPSRKLQNLSHKSKLSPSPSNAMLISALFFIVALEITFEFVTSQLFFILISSGESCIETVSSQNSQKIFGAMFEKLPLDKTMTIFIFLEFCLSNENDFFIFSMH